MTNSLIKIFAQLEADIKKHFNNTTTMLNVYKIKKSHVKQFDKKINNHISDIIIPELSRFIFSTSDIKNSLEESLFNFQEQQESNATFFNSTPSGITENIDQIQLQSSTNEDSVHYITFYLKFDKNFVVSLSYKPSFEFLDISLNDSQILQNNFNNWKHSNIILEEIVTLHSNDDVLLRNYSQNLENEQSIQLVDLQLTNIQQCLTISSLDINTSFKQQTQGKNIVQCFMKLLKQFEDKEVCLIQENNGDIKIVNFK